LNAALAINLIYIVTKVTITITSCFIKIFLLKFLYRFSEDRWDY